MGAARADALVRSTFLTDLVWMLCYMFVVKDPSTCSKELILLLSCAFKYIAVRIHNFHG